MKFVSGGFFIDEFHRRLDSLGFEEIILPSVEPAEVYTEKMGKEILSQMYVFPDKKGRSLCLRPEGTATCQVLARQRWKTQKDIKLYYDLRCWRYEKPQAGRYREFSQFGVEILNPRTDSKEDFRDTLMNQAIGMVDSSGVKYEVSQKVKRGLEYYVEDGFEISCPILGAQKQICGGGRYAEGIGFAIGLDRLILAMMISRGLVKGTTDGNPEAQLP
jgi:histidyl-tRNA synthetase